MTPAEERRTQQRTFGQRLRRRRLEAGITASQAAQHAGISHAMWANYEVGRKGYPVTRLLALASALGVPAASLLTDELVLAEVRISNETLERVKREGRPAAEEVAARIAQTLASLLLAQATAPARDFSSGARARPRRSREEVLAAREADIEVLNRRHAAIAEERRRARRVA